MTGRTVSAASVSPTQKCSSATEISCGENIGKTPSKKLFCINNLFMKFMSLGSELNIIFDFQRNQVALLQADNVGCKRTTQRYQKAARPPRTTLQVRYKNLFLKLYKID